MFATLRKTILTLLIATFALAAGSVLSVANAQSVSVIEYYNKALDAYFITGRSNEQASLDALPDFARTGMTFQAVAASEAMVGDVRICRFYINTVSPLVNSHFYGRETIDCEPIQAQNLSGFSWEGYDFAVRPPSAGVCAAGSTAIYRSFRAATSNKTANHRYTSSPETYAASASAGYAGESIAFCAIAATDASFVAPTQCGTIFYPGTRITYQSIDSDGLSDQWVRFHGPAKVSFNGKLAQPVIEQHLTGEVKTIMLDETVDTWTDLGSNLQTENEFIQTYYFPPTVIGRHMQIGQRIDINRYAAYGPVQAPDSPVQTGNFIFVGMELVQALNSTYMACKFSTQVTTDFPTIGRTDVRRTTTWVATGVGIVKAEIQETTNSGFGPVFPITTTDVSAVSLQLN